MARNIIDALAEWVAKQEKTRRQDAQAVAFLAIRSDVVTALEAGYSIKTVWAFLKDEGRITSSYEAFRRHVQRHIRSGQSAGARSNPAPVTPGQSSAVPQGQPPAQAAFKNKSAKPIGRFEFNSKPDREGLI